MTSLRDVVVPGGILLGVRAADSNALLEAVAARLAHAPGMRDFATFREVLAQKSQPFLDENGCGILLAHARTDCVSRIVLAAGRPVRPIEGEGSPLRLAFVFGIPTALSTEYLRAVGSLARVCSDAERLAELLAAGDAEIFLSVLAAGERPI
jgi:mannitol/fructose-specific phosphotransferase system IIA component (Ntr-type)